MQPAAPCDTRLVPADGVLGYRPRDRAARCEGLYRSPISGASLELVSLHQGPLRFELNPAVRLHLLPLTGAARVSGQAIRIRAVALPLRSYYRLDGVVSANRPLVWPIGDVLLPAKLTDTQVGVFGWVDEDVSNDRLFVPVRLVSADTPASAVLPAATILTVRAANDVERILWRSYTEQSAGDMPAWAVAGNGIAAGGAVSVVLPDGPEAVLTVDVTAKSADADRWSSLRIRLLRPARP